MNKIAIIGGGAGGMMAGIIAKREGADVTIYERNDRLGKKLLATGNGRCNYTNIYLTIDNYDGNNDKFAYSALSSLDTYMTMDFFEELGITPAVEETGKVFPQSYQSSSMLDILMLELDRLKINVRLESYIKNIEKKNNQFTIEVDGKKEIYDKVILATGGEAMPASGSDGNGYNLAKAFGHELIKPIPGLVQLNLEGKGNLFKQIKGVKVPGKVKLFIDGRYIKEDRGDVLFTDYGISGPPILQLSSKALKALDQNKNVVIEVSLIESATKEELKKYLKDRFENLKDRTVFESLIGLINKKLINPLLKEINLNPDKKIEKITDNEIYALADIIVAWKFKVTGSQGWKHAQITSGGINTDELDPKTMESKLQEGLYIIGELLDIDGDCGGYNLQWAWSSAYVAALSAAKN